MVRNQPRFFPRRESTRNLHFLAPIFTHRLCHWFRRTTETEESFSRRARISLVPREWLSSRRWRTFFLGGSSRGKCRCRNKGHERDPWHRRCRWCYRWCSATRKPLAIWHTPCHAASRPVYTRGLSVLRPSGRLVSLVDPRRERRVTPLRSSSRARSAILRTMPSY